MGILFMDVVILVDVKYNNNTECMVSILYNIYSVDPNKIDSLQIDVFFRICRVSVLDRYDLGIYCYSCCKLYGNWDSTYRSSTIVGHIMSLQRHITVNDRRKSQRLGAIFQMCFLLQNRLIQFCCKHKILLFTS